MSKHEITNQHFDLLNDEAERAESVAFVVTKWCTSSAAIVLLAELVVALAFPADDAVVVEMMESCILHRLVLQ